MDNNRARNRRIERNQDQELVIGYSSVPDSNGDTGVYVIPQYTYIPTQVVIDGVEQTDFGFRPLVCHLNDYDLFRDYAPCYESETNAHITAFFQRNWHEVTK